MARKSIDSKIKKQVLNRDGNRCQKCGANHCLESHHIKAVMDGGTDDLENLITLCNVCHSEWHSLEAGVKPEYIDNTFKEWMELPPLGRLIYAIRAIEQYPDISAKEWLETVKKLTVSMPRFQGTDDDDDD